MQNRFCCDVGDFGKYALLNALAGGDLRLGIMWYLNETPQSNNDGKFTEYDRLRPCDPVLHRKLSEILESGRRLLSSIEGAGILPSNTIYYREPLPLVDRPCYSGASRNQHHARREAWFTKATEELRPAKLIFLDPDNGMAGKTAKHCRASAKYVFLDELAYWRSHKKSVVLYQHQRRQLLSKQVSEQLDEFAPHARHGRALSFHSQSVRIYYILPATEQHHRFLWKKSEAFLNSVWGRKGHFRLHIGRF